jgi:HD-like signal output (HDOD) protein
VSVATSKLLQKKINDLGKLPAMPVVLHSLGGCLNADPSDADIEKVVELISYDKSPAAQCLRPANSSLLRTRVEADSVKTAAQALGLRRIRDVLHSCTSAKLFAGAKQGMAQDTFWRHALGAARVIAAACATSCGAKHREAVPCRAAARHRNSCQFAALREGFLSGL